MRPEAVADAIKDLLAASDMAIVFGASAMCDFDDVIPAAIRAAGGEVIRAGMPVDPGNLMVLGRIGGKTVIGAPGCARSPKENGFDWVLDRLLAGIDVTGRDIAGMGVGGLLMEIASRPQPRELRRAERRCGACGRACRRPVDPHGRAEQAARPLCWRDAYPARRSHRAGQPGEVGHGGHRPPGRACPRGACRARPAFRRQSGFCQRAGKFAQGGGRKPAFRCRRSAGPARRHAGDFQQRPGPSDRGLCRGRRAEGGARLSWRQARQSGHPAALGLPRSRSGCRAMSAPVM